MKKNHIPMYVYNNDLVPIVVEQTNNGERGMDIYSRLLQERIIFLGTAVDENSSAIICAQLLYLEYLDDQKDIYFYINSPGGSVSDGIALYDTMQYIRPDVVTVCIGQACSIAALLMIGGAENKRFSLPNSRIMVHQPRQDGIQGMASDIDITAKELIFMKNLVADLYVKHSGLSREKVDQLRDRDTWLDPMRAKELGFIDHVIASKDDVLNLGLT